MRGPMMMCAVVAMGCGGGAAETNLEDGFCRLLQSGPEASITAAATPEDAPELALADTVVEVDLLPEGDGFWGLAAFTADEPGSFAIGLSEDVDLIVRDAADSEIAPETVVDGSACAELVVRYTYPMEVATYWVEFTGAAADEVDVVSEESDDDL